jgi:hypothetical protein
MIRISEPDPIVKAPAKFFQDDEDFNMSDLEED